MDKTYLCSAVGTPLTEDDTLHLEGLQLHLEDQQTSGMDGILIAGTMGAMQLLTGSTYESLVRHSSSLWSQGELLVGVGDMSVARTMERLSIVNDLEVDGVVVLPPFFLSYTQADLCEYFEWIAKSSRYPVYLYDLPQRTGVTLETDTILRLAEHPNIRGIKCSSDLSRTRRLCDLLRGEEFRIIVAQTMVIDVLLRAGFRQHVDGVFCIAPHLVREIAAAAEQGDWVTASQRTGLLNDFLMTIVHYGVFPGMTVILNSKGIPGNYAPRPHRPLPFDVGERLLSEPAVRNAIGH
jgi:4-hydroxy-tetrahydrodipicolinate synthase